ncbi:calcium-independent phospholipase A2-gamma [Patella vulgata]|uniref:calcium-independent phospholipase A2-gamma n=1 Tax=Patella vulgata TaxID=6465 RepID=UPI0021802B59|nr:calcium-independent phospholipase A2-gamma [Patella vulgata]
MAALRIPVKSCTARHLSCPFQPAQSGWRSSSPSGRVNEATMIRCEMATYQQTYHNHTISQKPEKDEKDKNKNKSTMETIKEQLKSIQKMKDSISGAVVQFGAITAAIPRGITSDFQKYIPFVGDSSVRERTMKPVVRRKKIISNNVSADREQHTFEKAMLDTQESISSFYDQTNTHQYLRSPVAMVKGTNTENVDKETTNLIRNVLITASARTDPTNQPEKVKKPLIQKDFVSKSAIDSRTRALVHAIKAAKSSMSKLTRTEELCKHILQYPNSRTVAYREKVLPHLLKFCKSSDKSLKAQANEALALIGYVPKLKGRGIRIISIDGGGTRGLVAIETLRRLQEACQTDIRDMFDYVCGVSTGSLIAAMIFLFRISLDEAEHLYLEFSKQMFSRNRIVGTSKLVWTHAFYDSTIWENILKEQLGHKRMIEFSRSTHCPRFSGVSSVMNLPMMKNFMFRNYNLPPGVYSHYPGSCNHEIWEVIRASSAAPGYFEQFNHGDYVHQDGGLLTNNPTALALHESKLLWPEESVQCVISLGTGRYEPNFEFAPNKLSLKDKLSKIVDSATDTEAVHVTCQDLLPPSSYFRFNPYMSEMFFLDEIRPDKLNLIKQDAKMYLRKNKVKMETAVGQLVQSRRPDQVVYDWIKNSRGNI